VSRFGFEVSSRLAAPADTVWRHATSMRGVSAELFPLVRTTHPRGLDSLAPVFAAVFHLAFRLRHLNLRRRFGMLAL